MVHNWLRVICIFVTRERGQGNLFWEGYFHFSQTNSSCACWHFLQCVCGLHFSQCVLLYVFMCAIVRIGPDLARQSDLHWLRSSLPLLWILMSCLSLPIHPQLRPSLCESLKDFASVLFHLGPLAIFSLPVVVTANRIISLVFTAAPGNYGWRSIHRYPTWIWETLAISWIIWDNCLSGCSVPDRSCTMEFWSLIAFSKQEWTKKSKANVGCRTKTNASAEEACMVIVIIHCPSPTLKNLYLS